MPMPNYKIQGVPQLQQQQGPLGALTEFAKGEALSRGLDAAFPGAGLAKDAATAVAGSYFDEGGKVPWWKKAWKNDGAKKKQEAAKKRFENKGEGVDKGSIIASLLSAGFFQGGGSVKPMYQRMGGMTPGPLGMSDMLAAGKGKDISKVVYKKKGGDIEDTVEIGYHAPLAAKPSGDK